jgi:hypothetical protein
MAYMSVTELVSQLLRGWLKFSASVNLASERASDARSERGRERVGAGERTAGEVSTHILDMVVTELVSQLSRGWLKILAFQNLASERATRGASVSVGESGRAIARRARSVPTWKTCSSPNSCSSYSGAGRSSRRHRTWRAGERRAERAWA